jgi:superfamily I DNA/RNA helicase/RecB family exonuclease
MQWRLNLDPLPVATPPRLDDEQRAVVAHDEGPLLVLAGPGTGKTTTIAEAIVARLSDGIPADQVLALTFGRRAAGELRDRVTARLAGGAAPLVATFHSFAYGLLRQTASPEEYTAVPRLLSGAEEDVRIRELLRGAVELGTVDWPEELAGALPTLGLAAEVRAVLARARELGLDGAALLDLGRRVGRPAWTAVGQLADEDAEVMALENVMDYGTLLVEAVARATSAEVGPVLRARYRVIYVDEYQDTDPLQVALLRALVGPQTAIVAVGDPDQSIYAFRGADVAGLLRFPEDFRRPDGSPADVVVLRNTRRFGPKVRAAAVALLGSRLPTRLPAHQIAAHRSPLCTAPADPTTDDIVTVRLYDDHGAQAAHLARELRTAHVRREVPWHELAVLVRSGGQLPALQRALRAAGVPVTVAADEVPLRSEPAVATLLGALALATRPATLSPAQVVDVLTGPLVGLTPGDLRRLGRALRAQAHQDGQAAPASDALLRDLIVSGLSGDPAPDAPVMPLAADDAIAVTIGRTIDLLGRVRELVESGAGPAPVLWLLWSGGSSPHGWPDRLRAAALAGSSSADHDLDAVLALFDAADRLVDRYAGVLGIEGFVDFLAGQLIPAESVAERGARADAVRLLTAHRAKGLEWDEVWVVGLEEGSWPDLRSRGSTLRVEELSADGIGSGPRPSDLLAEERRLAYVACTRARRRLHLSAVDAPSDAGERYSRFVDDLDSAGIVAARVSGRPASALSLDGLVAELRGVAADPAADQTLRAAAVERLAVLAAAHTDDGRPLVPLADPATWWGLRELTPGAVAIRDPQAPISLSGSALDSVLGCPLKWFLEREASAEVARGAATGFGSLVHAIADFVAKGEVPADLDEMDERAGRVWNELRFEAGWQSVAQRADARAALERFLAYHQRADRRLVGTEISVRTELEVPTPDGGVEQVRLTGFIDRVEIDSAGRAVAIDLKNMKSPPKAADIPEHGQLGVYQLLLRDGAWLPDQSDETDETDEAESVPVGGAALVQLRTPESSKDPAAKVQFQESLPQEEPTWVEVKLGQAAAILRSEQFDAVPGSACNYCVLRTSCPAQAVGKTVVP